MAGVITGIGGYLCKGKRVNCRSLFFVPYITPMVIVAIIWKSLYQYPSGYMNSVIHILSLGHAPAIDWLSDQHWALLAIIFLSAWQAYGFQMVIYLGGLQSIPETLYEAASIDGPNLPTYV